MLGADVARDGYGVELCHLIAIFYTDNAFIALRDPEFLQRAMHVLIHLFECAGLQTSTLNTNVMTCLLGRIRCRLPSASYSHM